MNAFAIPISRYIFVKIILLLFSFVLNKHLNSLSALIWIPSKNFFFENQSDMWSLGFTSFFKGLEHLSFPFSDFELFRENQRYWWMRSCLSAAEISPIPGSCLPFKRIDWLLGAPLADHSKWSVVRAQRSESQSPGDWEFSASIADVKVSSFFYWVSKARARF